MKMQDINEMSQSEIELGLSDKLEELYNLRFQHAMHQLDNPLKLRDVRRDIARLKTVLHEFEMGIRKPREATQQS